MGIWDSLVGNETFKKMAFGKLTSFMEEQGLHAIIIRADPDGPGTFIPGYAVDMYKVPIIVFDNTTSIVAITKDQLDEYNSLFNLREMGFILSEEEFEAWNDPEVKNYIDRYIRAKNLTHGEDTTNTASETDTHAATDEYDSDFPKFPR